MNRPKYLKDRTFLGALVFWRIATIGYFQFVAMGYPLSPIAVDGLGSLLTFYIPVLILTVFLLLYLTRKRLPVKWNELYAVNKTTAKKEAWLSVGYLLLTQMILGLGFNMGLHFPGTDIYSTGSHSQTDVWIWAVTYTVTYTVLPMLWLRSRGFSLRKLLSSLQWIRDLWIIIVYWALDFFGPILAVATGFIGGITASQYAQGVP